MLWVLEPATRHDSGGAIHAAVIRGSASSRQAGADREGNRAYPKAVVGNVRQSDATGQPATREGADAAQDRTMAARTRRCRPTPRGLAGNKPFRRIIL